MRRNLLCVLVIVGVFGAVGMAAAQDYFPQSVASGDPRPDSVVLWTRVDSPFEIDPKPVGLEVATDVAFTDIVVERALFAGSEYDYCVKVKVSGLDPYTTYYYRFTHYEGTSPTGRTRTAPAADAEQPMRFAVAYCQDYIGRYYNTYLKMLLDHDADLDFVVFLGDYIYETSGNPAFQDCGDDDACERAIKFDDIEGAIPLGDPDDPYYAAASLSNYRTLYRTYRTDPILQRVHERWPMLVMWDDHEFSDDSWGATATYTNGRSDELQPDRRRAAEQAFFEWIPIEVGLDAGGLLEVDSSILYPNTRIYRDFQFGTNLHLVLTDYRTYRPDHIVPEDAFPGEIVLDETTLRQVMSDPVFDVVRSNFDPYINVDLFGQTILRQTLTLILAQVAKMEVSGLDTTGAMAIARSHVGGNMSATYINALFAAAGLSAPFSAQVMDALPHGLSYLDVGKQNLYDPTGSRYLLLNDSYNLLASVMFATTLGEAQNAFGGQQEAWMGGVMQGTDATWKVLASSASMAPMVIDFTNPVLAAMLPDAFPDVLRTRLKLNVDQWDGFPDRRAMLVDMLSTIGNAVVISGDIHSTFVSDHGGGVYEFTGPAVSSETFGGMVANRVAGDPTLGQVPGLDALVAQLASLLQLSAMDDENVSPSDIYYASTTTHGYTIVDATADALAVTIQQIPASEIYTSYYDDPEALDALFTPIPFTVQNGMLIPGGS